MDTKGFTPDFTGEEQLKYGKKSADFFNLSIINDNNSQESKSPQPKKYEYDGDYSSDSSKKSTKIKNKSNLNNKAPFAQ